MPLEHLMQLARDTLRTVSAVPERLPAPLVYVLQTAGGNTRIVINDDYQTVLAEMSEKRDTVVEAVLAMWKEGIVDVPSYAFRKELLELDGANGETWVFVMTGRGYAARALKDLM